MAEILRQFEPNIDSITLIPSDGGRFEFVVNGSLIFSKLKSHRHPEPGEIKTLIGKMMHVDKPQG